MTTFILIAFFLFFFFIAVGDELAVGPLPTNTRLDVKRTNLKRFSRTVNCTNCSTRRLFSNHQP